VKKLRRPATFPARLYLQSATLIPNRTIDGVCRRTDGGVGIWVVGHVTRSEAVATARLHAFLLGYPRAGTERRPCRSRERCPTRETRASRYITSARSSICMDLPVEDPQTVVTRDLSILVSCDLINLLCSSCPFPRFLCRCRRESHQHLSTGTLPALRSGRPRYNLHDYSLFSVVVCGQRRIIATQSSD
jgi:hypothetical protein